MPALLMPMQNFIPPFFRDQTFAFNRKTKIQAVHLAVIHYMKSERIDKPYLCSSRTIRALFKKTTGKTLSTSYQTRMHTKHIC